MNDRTAGELVDTAILVRGVNDVGPVCDRKIAAEAVLAVLGLSAQGTEREIEPVEGGGWLVEFTEDELRVLQTQGHLDLEKGQYTIRAEWP